jgi:nicotinamide-nucleotide amidase
MLIARLGAVSEEVARAMAEGALVRSRAGIAVSVTGVAGPGGGSAEKPVGLVCFGLAQRDRDVASEHLIFPGDRAAIRAAAVAHSFAMIRARL